MGYRTYIASFSKREYNKIKSMNEEQLIDFYKIKIDEDGEWYKGVYDFGKELYCFGKYTDFLPPKKSVKTFFKNKELHNKYNEEHDFYLVDKDFLAYIIEYYKQKVCNHYNLMINPFINDKDFQNSIKTVYGMDNNHTYDYSKITQEQQNALHLMLGDIEYKNLLWNGSMVFDLDESDQVTDSWLYEYGIFELIRIYKSFDWKRNVLIYYGY